MRIVNLPHGDKFAIRETDQELPINRFHDLHKYLIQAAGIGSTPADIDNRMRSLYSFLQAGILEDAATEAYNMHNAFLLALNRINIRHVAFMCLVDSINDKPVNDYSESNLIAISDQLGRMGLVEGMVSDILETVKKNLIPLSE